MSAPYGITQWHVPLACQGQIVEVAYGIDGETQTAVRRTTDRSDGSVAYEEADVSHLEEVEWDPANGRLGDISDEDWDVAP